MSKNYTDQRRGAPYSEVEVGDRVLMQQDRWDKLTTTYRPTPCDVVAKSGNSLIVRSPDGTEQPEHDTCTKVHGDERRSPSTIRRQ